MIMKKLAVCMASLFALTNIAAADVSVKVHDLNSDGSVTLQEVIDFHDPAITRTDAFLARHKAMFEAADVNSDGVVDASESQDGSRSTKKGKKANKS